jgi:hypothetical protein
MLRALAPHGLTRPTPLFTVKNGAASASYQTVKNVFMGAARCRRELAQCWGQMQIQNGREADWVGHMTSWLVHAAAGTFAVRPNGLMRLYRRRVRHDWPPHVNLGSGLLSDHPGGKVVARIGGLCKLLTHRGHKPGRNPAVQRALT